MHQGQLPPCSLRILYMHPARNIVRNKNEVVIFECSPKLLSINFRLERHVVMMRTGGDCPIKERRRRGIGCLVCAASPKEKRMTMKQQKIAHPKFVKKRDPQCCRLCYAAMMERYRRSWSVMQVTVRRCVDASNERKTPPPCIARNTNALMIRERKEDSGPRWS